MRRGLAPVMGTSLLLVALLAGCSDDPDKQTGTPAPTDVTPIPTAAPPAASIKLGPTGTATAPGCQGLAITPRQDAQRVIDENPANTTFCFTKGLHRITRPLRPAAGATLASSEGAVLTGSVELAGWQRNGGDWVVRGALPAPYERKGKCEDERTNPCRSANNSSPTGITSPA